MLVVLTNSTSKQSIAGRIGPTSYDLTFYKEHGFYSYNDTKWAYYDLRPEVLEVRYRFCLLVSHRLRTAIVKSNFYAWRATGDLKVSTV